MSPSDELKNLRILAGNWAQLAAAAGAWRARFVDQIGPQNAGLFDPAELALIRAIDTMPEFVTVEGVVIRVHLGRCECVHCAVELTVRAPDHCLGWRSNRLHTCAALEAMDRAREAIAVPDSGAAQ